MGYGTHQLKLIGAFATIYLIWGSTFLAIRFAIETIPPWLMAGCRFFLAGVPLLLWAAMRGEGRPHRSDWIDAVLVGGLLFLGGHGALAWAEQSIPSGIAALILTTIPLWMSALEAVRPGGVKLNGGILCGLALGILGVALLVGPSQLLGGARVDPFAAGVLVLGALSWSIGSVGSRSLPRRGSTTLTTGLRLIVGGSLLLLAGLLAGELQRLDPAVLSPRSLAALAYLILFGSILAFTAYTWLLGAASPARVGTYAFVNPVVAVFLGWSLAGEPLTLRVVASGILVLSAVAIVLKTSRAGVTPAAPTRRRPDALLKAPACGHPGTADLAAPQLTIEED